MIEFNSFDFAHKTHDEKIKYVTWDSRFIYTAFLNKAEFNHFLDNKYEAYKLLKPYYKREAMLLTDENDYEAFCAFVKKHPKLFIKPNNLELAEGAHRLVYEPEKLQEAFAALLEEAHGLASVNVKREIDHRLILEELIEPSDFIKELNPDDMSLLRVTTINIKGQIHFFYPCLRLLVGDGQSEIGEDTSLKT